jgi:hypothetical protein
VFENLDFVYLPSRDVAHDLQHFTEALGATFVFAIEAFGTRVAMVTLAEDSPAVLLAGHLEGEQPILVYRVSDLEQSIAELERQRRRDRCAVWDPAWPWGRTRDTRTTAHRDLRAHPTPGRCPSCRSSRLLSSY